jgi:hypothetical protein
MHSRGLPEAAAAARRLELPPDEEEAGTGTLRKSVSSRTGDTKSSVPPGLGALLRRPVRGIK